MEQFLCFRNTHNLPTTIRFQYVGGVEKPVQIIACYNYCRTSEGSTYMSISAAILKKDNNIIYNSCSFLLRK